MLQVLHGMALTCSFVVGVLFLRFYHRTRDQFFAFFAAAFWTMTLNWVGLAMTSPEDELRPYFYVLRLLAFLLIITAIIDKNRPRRPSG